MEFLLAIVIGGLYATGIFLIMRRSVVKLIIGLAILGHAANLLIFTAAGLTRGQAPLVVRGQVAPPEGYADPLPQALVLTAIVIGFAVLAFASVLFKRAYKTVDTDDLDEMKATDT